MQQKNEGLNDDESAIERRKAPRIPFNRALVAYINAKRVECHGVDISAEGIGLLLSSQHDLKSEIKINLPLHRGKSVAISGTVVHCQKGAIDMRYGLKFREIPRAIKLLIDEFIESEKTVSKRPTVLCTKV